MTFIELRCRNELCLAAEEPVALVADDDGYYFDPGCWACEGRLCFLSAIIPMPERSGCWPA